MSTSTRKILTTDSSQWFFVSLNANLNPHFSIISRKTKGGESVFMVCPSDDAMHFFVCFFFFVLLPTSNRGVLIRILKSRRTKMSCLAWYGANRRIFFFIDHSFSCCIHILFFFINKIVAVAVSKKRVILALLMWYINNQRISYHRSYHSGSSNSYVFLLLSSCTFCDRCSVSCSNHINGSSINSLWLKHKK